VSGDDGWLDGRDERDETGMPLSFRWSPFAQWAVLRARCRTLSLPSPSESPPDSACLVFATGMMPESPGEVWFAADGQESLLVARRGWGTLSLSSPTAGVIYRTGFGWGPAKGGRVVIKLCPGEVYLYQVRHVYFRRGVVLRLAPANEQLGRRRMRYSVVEIIT
jgi:hypothetical protein